MDLLRFLPNIIDFEKIAFNEKTQKSKKIVIKLLYNDPKLNEFHKNDFIKCDYLKFYLDVMIYDRYDDYKLLKYFNFNDKIIFVLKQEEAKNE